MFEHGQYVTFRMPAEPQIFVAGKVAKITDLGEVAAIEKAVYHNSAGRLVGIYQEAGIDPVTRAPTPACVTPVKPDGTNVRFLWGAEGVRVDFVPGSLLELRLRASLDDIPPGRRATMSETAKASIAPA